MRIHSLLLFAIILISSCANKVENAKSEMKKNTKQLRHLVLFEFKETSTDADIKKIEAAFIDLPNKISEIKNFEWGLNNSPEGLNKNFTHCFFLTFDSEEARAAYLPHPVHKAFVEILKPHLKDVLVLDYWVK